MIDKVVARLMMLSFFLPLQWQPVVVFAAAIYFIVVSARAKGGIPKRNIPPALFLGASYLLYLGAFLFTPKAFIPVVSRLCEYRAGYLLLPVAFAFIAKEKLDVIYKEFIWFIYGALFVTLAANVAFVMKYATAPGGFHGLTHVTYRVFFEGFCGQHPTYMSMYLVLGAGYLLLNGDIVNRWLKYILFYAILIFLLPLLAKSPLIALGFILMHQAWQRRAGLWQYKWVFAGMLLVLVVSYLFVPFVGQRVQEMVGQPGHTDAGNVISNSIYARKMIWSVDTTLLRHYWLAGCGPGRIMYLLHIRYLFYSLQYGFDTMAYDPHNEYFYQWISFGLVGIVLFLSVIFIHVFTGYKHKDFLYLYLMLIFVINCFTESVLTTQHGLFFYSFFTALFFFMVRGGEKKTAA
jgi:O-antigen ligase